MCLDEGVTTIIHNNYFCRTEFSEMMSATLYGYIFRSTEVNVRTCETFLGASHVMLTWIFSSLVVLLIVSELQE